jgi:pilus assembly protein CpaF
MSEDFSKRVTGFLTRTPAKRSPFPEVPSKLVQLKPASEPVTTRALAPVVAIPTAIAPILDTPVFRAKHILERELWNNIDALNASKKTREQLEVEFPPIFIEILAGRVVLNREEQKELTVKIVDEMLGLGPLEPLLADDTINDILVNGHDRVYIERSGILELSDVTFKDEEHVMHVATRIATWVGRRIDESHPMVDARLKDGSRVNIIAPPLSLKGTTISIRKFTKRLITLDEMVKTGGCSQAMANYLGIISKARCNILISGGTGSGKTTLLNALSGLIDPVERIITIEDAAELRLHQPHVVSLETRNASVEGTGRVTIRDLFINALRMRPDRIILGEVRGDEAFDLLNAMNTGHDGSLGTIHANTPRDATTRLENMVIMVNSALSPKGIRTQISSAIDAIVQVSRLKDGTRKITSISEVMHTEGDILVMQELFKFSHRDGFVKSGLHPHSWPKIEAASLEEQYRTLV